MRDEERPDAADGRRQALTALLNSLAVAAFFGGYLLTFWLTPPKVNAEFMSTAAQVIPVILLTLTIETRVLVAQRGSSLPLRRPRGRAAGFVLGMWPVMVVTAGAVLVWAEIVALAAVNGNATDGNGGRVVFAAIVGGFLAVLIGSLAPRGD